MRIFSLATVAFVSVLAARPASALPITLEITYEGMPANAGNEISSVTFTETGVSFIHPTSNISPELLEFVVQGSLLSNVSITALDGAIPLGSFTFSDVVFTNFSFDVNGLDEHVSFVFNPPSQGFYTIDYPGISPTAENGISSLTLNQTSASFTHPIGNISPQLLEFVALGTMLSSVTFSPVDASSPFGTLRFDHVFFTSVAFSGPLDLLEDVSFTFSELVIEAPITRPMPEPGAWLMTISGVFALVLRRRARGC